MNIWYVVKEFDEESYSYIESIFSETTELCKSYIDSYTGSSLFIALNENDGTVYAYALVSIENGLYSGLELGDNIDLLRILCLEVKDQYRGNGIGQLLTDHILSLITSYSAIVEKSYNDEFWSKMGFNDTSSSNNWMLK